MGVALLIQVDQVQGSPVQFISNGQDKDGGGYPLDLLDNIGMSPGKRTSKRTSNCIVSKVCSSEITACLKLYVSYMFGFL